MQIHLRHPLGMLVAGVLCAVAASCGAVAPEEVVGSAGEGLSKCLGGKLGDSNYCSTSCKCDPGEGDCDSAAECTGGSVCVGKGLYFYGVASNACAPAHCGNGVRDNTLGETQVDCGGPCGSLCPDPCAGLPPNGSAGHCTTDCPCGPREGDCAASTTKCESGNTCSLSQGAFFGFGNTRDVCLANTCSNGQQDGDETELDCGPSCKPCSAEHVLSFRAGSAAPDHAFAVTVDAGRSLIIGGRVEMGGVNYQLLKYDSAGTLSWRRAFGVPTGGFGITALGTDNARNIYVTGVFSGTVPFLGVSLTSAGSGDIFVLKLDASGNRIWVKQFGGAGSERTDSIAVRGTGETYLAGSFTAATDFGGGLLTNAGGKDALVLRLDTLGNHVYSRGFGGTGNDEALGIAVDGNGNALVAGSYAQSVDFGTGPQTSRGAVDGFLVKLGPTGDTSWVNVMGGTSSDQALAVTVDGTGQPSVVGFFKRSVDFGGGPIRALGGDDAFLAAYTAGGAHRFSYTLGGATHSRAVGVVSDATGGIAVIGDFQGADASFGALGTRSSQGGRDVFVNRFDATGAPLWVSTFGAAAEDLPRAAALRDGLLTVVGDFKSTVTFGGAALTSAGEFDAFVARYAF